MIEDPDIAMIKSRADRKVFLFLFFGDGLGGGGGWVCLIELIKVVAWEV